MASEKIAKAKPLEFALLSKCFRRVGIEDGEKLNRRIGEERLLALAEEGEVLILKSDKHILGAIAGTSRWENALFPLSHSYAKSDDVLDAFPYQGERVVYLDFIFIDPMDQRKGKGKELLNAYLHRYEETSFLVLLHDDDAIPFFTSMGFHPLFGNGENEVMPEAKLFVKPFVKTGICSDPPF